MLPFSLREPRAHGHPSNAKNILQFYAMTEGSIRVGPIQMYKVIHMRLREKGSREDEVTHGSSLQLLYVDFRIVP